ncbi:hypothetical protein IWX91DRAFT_336310 [Phyllosticta citricarpa]
MWNHVGLCSWVSPMWLVTARCFHGSVLECPAVDMTPARRRYFGSRSSPSSTISKPTERSGIGRRIRSTLDVVGEALGGSIAASWNHGHTLAEATRHHGGRRGGSP